jgi:hypothetical protein
MSTYLPPDVLGKLVLHAEEPEADISLFLSHASKDKPIVRRLARKLKSTGIRVWLDEWEIKVGDSITQLIQRAITECDCIAVWLTKNSVESKWVEREWQAKYFAEVSCDRTLVLPLLAEDCSLPIFLADKKYADFSTDFNAGLNSLLGSLGIERERKFRQQVAHLKPRILNLLKSAQRGLIADVVLALGGIDFGYSESVCCTAFKELVVERRIEYDPLNRTFCIAGRAASGS